MADHDLDSIVDADDLVEVARATRVLVLRLDGIKGENGVLQRIERASESLDKIDANLIAAVEKAGDVAKFGQQIHELPECLLSKADSVAFRIVVAKVLGEETEAAVQVIQRSGLDSFSDELTRRMDRAADDVVGRKFAPAMHDANALARAKSDCETYKTRAETAEKVLGEIKVVSEKAESNLIAQIERIRLSTVQPNSWALFAVFALGWGSALFASAGWDVVTTSLLGHPIP